MFRKNIFYALIIIVAGLIIIGPSFKLGFNGDDWLTLYRFRINVGDWSIHKYNYLTYFLSPYGPQDTILGLLQRLFGYRADIFYLVSFVLRTITGLTIYWFVLKFTKNYLASLVAGLFFVVSIIGFDTTNWVFNMPSYISLTLFLFFAYNFIQSQINYSYKNAFLCIPLFYLTFIFAPIRMHGLPIIALMLDLFWIIKSKSMTSVKLSIFHQVSLLATLVFIKISSNSIGLSVIGGNLSDGINLIFSSINKYNFSFILTPLAIVGRFFVPETVWPVIKSTFPNPTIVSVVLYTNLLLLPLIILNLQLGKNKHLQILFLSLCAILVSAIYKSSYSTVVPEIFGAALLGGEFLILGIFLILRHFSERISILLFFPLSWILVSFFYPYLLAPYTFFGAPHRYLIIPCLGVSIFWGMIVHLAPNKNLQGYIVFIYFLFLSIQIASTQNYLSSLLKSRNSNLTNSIWKSLPTIENPGQGTQPLVFYFEGDSAIIYQSLTFGFPPHIAMIYNFNENQGKLPISISSWDELVATVTTGDNMPAYNYPQKPVSLENIFAFSLSGDKLKDITNEKRLLLKTTHSLP